MKSIAILTASPCRFDQFHIENLQRVFANGFIYNNYHLSSLQPGDIISDDIVLASVQSYAIKAKDYISEKSRIIITRRTLPANEIYKLVAIPAGSNVLVVNDEPETTAETVTLLYQLNINHLNLIPYNPARQYPDIKIAITPGEPQLVPSHIETVIDVGFRCLDISTFLSILNHFNIDDSATHQTAYRILRQHRHAG